MQRMKRRTGGAWMLTALGLLTCGASPAAAQMMHGATPFGATNNSFFERIGTSWGAAGHNWHFDVGGGGGAPQAPFGGGANAPNAGASGGFAIIGPNAHGYFNWEASQGSKSSYTNQTPSVTTTNGYPGFVADVSQSPFVISVVPVVGQGQGGGGVVGGGYGAAGGYEDFGAANTIQGRARRGELPPRLAAALQRAYAKPAEPDADGMPQARAEAPADAVVGRRLPADDAAPADQAPLQIRPRAAAAGAGTVARAAGGGGGAVGASTADGPAESLASLRAKKGAPVDPDEEARGNLEKGRAAQADGKWGAARIYYQMAVKQAAGEALRQEARALLSSAQQRK